MQCDVVYRRPALHIANRPMWGHLALWLCLASISPAQSPDTYRMFAAGLPPGSIGQRQLRHGRLPAGKSQPIRVSAPQGTLVSAAQSGSFGTSQVTPAGFGVEVGRIYRFQLTNIPNLDGVELYPSVEIIGHLSPPPGKERDHPVPIFFAIEDLRIAAEGGFVTRVVYVEDPDLAIPGKQDPNDQPYFEVGLGEDPLHVAEDLGRPIAIVRIGSKTPGPGGPDDSFTFNAPYIEEYFDSQSNRTTTHFGVSHQPSPVNRVSHSRPVTPSDQQTSEPINLAPQRKNRKKSSVRRSTPVPVPVQAARRRSKRPSNIGHSSMPMPYAPVSQQMTERFR